MILPINFFEAIESLPNPKSSNSFSLLPKIKEKPSPDDLVEEIDNSQASAGATIIIADKDDNSIIHKITNSFYLSALSFNRREKAQVLETFDSPFVSFFGDTVKVYNFQGRTVDYPSSGTGDSAAKTMHQSSLTRLYDQHLRGSELVKNNRVAIMRVLNHTIYGFPISFSTSYSGNVDKMSGFTMSWVVFNHGYSLTNVFTEQDLDNTSEPGLLLSSEKSNALLKINEFSEQYENYKVKEVNIPNNLNKTFKDASTFLLAYGALALGTSSLSSKNEIQQSIQNNLVPATKAFLDFIITLRGITGLSVSEAEELKNLSSGLVNPDTDTILNKFSNFWKTVSAYQRSLAINKAFLTL